jgi:L-lactate dehydrogenase complex protein LldE
MSGNNKPKISLFIPCLVDQVYPEIGIDMAKILKHLGYQVVYDSQQTCCGQPAFNAGHRDEAHEVASKFTKVFSSSDVIVCPSGSCTAMVKNYYPTLFANDPLEKTAIELGKRVFEFSAFLAHHDQIKNITGTYSGKVGFHNSCHSLRELGIDQEPLKILQRIEGLEIIQPSGDPICCGFGGLFSFKFDEISATMAKTRIEAFTSLGVDTIVTNDPGCLMHMRQESIDRHYELNMLHLTEFLAKALQL